MVEEPNLRVHRTWVGPSPLLGPSLWVWVQGCPRRCPGCFNLESLSFEGGEAVRVGELALRCTEAGVNLVLSGGEPFEQARALAALCRLVRERRPATEILVYSGYSLEELLAPTMADARTLLAEVDLLIDGPYDRTRPSDHALVGSDNQRLFFLSARIERTRVEALSAPRLSAELSRGRLRLVGTGSAETDMHRVVREIRAQGVVLAPERRRAD